MTYRVEWSQQALASIFDIYQYIAVFNPPAAQRVANRLREAGDGLCEFPQRGRTWSSDFRELTVVWPYVIRYSIEVNVVTIIRIRHGARQPD